MRGSASHSLLYRELRYTHGVKLSEVAPFVPTATARVAPERSAPSPGCRGIFLKVCVEKERMPVNVDEAKLVQLFAELLSASKALLSASAEKDSTGRQVIEEIKEDLSAGKRIEAAEKAKVLIECERQLARLQLGSYPQSEIALEVAWVLAEALDNPRNSHVQRGRPKLRPDPRRRKAARAYYSAIIGRHLIDGDELDNLDIFLFYLYTRAQTMGHLKPSDPKFRHECLPYAKKILKTLGLENCPRQGFRGETLRRCAQKYRVTESQLDRELARELTTEDVLLGDPCTELLQ
jgi:hypothetical protein